MTTAAAWMPSWATFIDEALGHVDYVFHLTVALESARSSLASP